MTETEATDVNETDGTILVLDSLKREFSAPGPKLWKFFVMGHLVCVQRYKRKESDIFELYLSHKRIGSYTGLELLEELADRCPDIARKLAKPTLS